MKKGFTLVELLAVIVILAIILAIAVPTISNLIENSKKGMFENSAKLILRSMKNDYDGKIATTGAFTDTFILYEDGVRTVYPDSNNLDFTLSATDGGIVRHSDGTVTFALYNGTYCSVKKRYSNDIIITATDKATCISNIIYKENSAPFTNLITNGDFSNGTNGWWAEYASNSVSNKILTNKASGNNAVANPVQTLSLRTIGNKYYMNASFRVGNSECTSITIIHVNSSWSTVMNNPEKDKWYNFSDLRQANSTYQHLAIRHVYPSAAVAAQQKTMDIKDVIYIDLTSTYGAGNEPTKEQMDNNVNKIWIDTTNANTPKKFGGGGWINF